MYRYFFIRMYRSVLCSMLFFSFMGSSAYALPEGSGFQYVYSKDSDGVTTNSFAFDSSQEDQEMPFSYKLAYTHLDQAGGSIKETSLVGRWHRPFRGDQALTLWAGVAHNEQYNFVPYSAMYDKAFSYKDHMWLSFEHQTVGTVEAYNARIHTNNYIFTYQNRLHSKLDWTTTFNRGFYSDRNQENIVESSLTQTFNRQLKLALVYNYDNAKFTNPGVYYVPQGLRVLSLKPEATLEIGQGALVFYLQQPLRARNNSGHISYYNYGVDYKVGGFTMGYMYTKDDTYYSRVYKAAYVTEW